MKIKIKKKIIEEVDAELPFYSEDYFDDSYGQHTVYKKIEENSVISIEIHSYYRNRIESFSIKREIFKWLKPSEYCGDFSNMEKSTEEEFEKAKNRALNFLEME